MRIRLPRARDTAQEATHAFRLFVKHFNNRKRRCRQKYANVFLMELIFFCLIILIRELLLVFIITYIDIVAFYVNSYENPSQNHVASWHIITAHDGAILTLIFCL